MKALVIKKLSIDHSLLIGNKQKPNLWLTNSTPSNLIHIWSSLISPVVHAT
jgi:hypothetical protein